MGNSLTSVLWCLCVGALGLRMLQELRGQESSGLSSDLHFKRAQDVLEEKVSYLIDNVVIDVGL